VTCKKLRVQNEERVVETAGNVSLGLRKSKNKSPKNRNTEADHRAIRIDSLWYRDTMLSVEDSMMVPCNKATVGGSIMVPGNKAIRIDSMMVPDYKATVGGSMIVPQQSYRWR
jgi:hypothetical protein